MRHIRVSTIIALLSTSLMLSACGEGWVAEQFRGGVPYTEERTAGPGIRYVLAKLAPPAGPVLEPVLEQVEEEAAFGPEWVPALEGTEIPDEEPVIQDAEPLFDQETKK